MQHKNLNDHLAPPKILPPTSKGSEYPWLEAPGIDYRKSLTTVVDYVTNNNAVLIYIYWKDIQEITLFISNIYKMLRNVFSK